MIYTFSLLQTRGSQTGTLQILNQLLWRILLWKMLYKLSLVRSLYKIQPEILDVICGTNIKLWSVERRWQNGLGLWDPRNDTEVSPWVYFLSHNIPDLELKKHQPQNINGPDKSPNKSLPCLAEGSGMQQLSKTERFQTVTTLLQAKATAPPKPPRKDQLGTSTSAPTRL